MENLLEVVEKFLSLSDEKLEELEKYEEIINIIDKSAYINYNVECMCMCTTCYF